jgi:carbohydrate-selective porin OprB
MKKLITIALIVSSSIALAGESWAERDRLTGDWGGARTNLEARGVTPFAYYDSIFAANVSGGKKTGGEFTGQVYAGFDLDLETLLGWQDTIMKISMVERHGKSVASDVGGIYDPMCIYGGSEGQKTILYQFWIEKTFDEKLAVKFGRDSQDSDFANDDLYRYSLSTAINGPIRSMMLDRPQIVSFPLGVWHGRAKYTFNDEHQLQVGAYQINDHIWDNIPGTDWSIDSDDGVTFIAQYDWTPQIMERPSRLYVGVADSVYDTTAFDGDSKDNIFRLYGHFDFEVVENLTLFAFGAVTPQDDVVSMPLQISCGANYKGLFAGREDDHTMAFLTYAGLSDDWGDSLGRDADYEMVYELGHRFQLTPAIYVQPSAQYIMNPGGAGSIDDAVVLGAWVGAAF